MVGITRSKVIFFIVFRMLMCLGCAYVLLPEAYHTIIHNSILPPHHSSTRIASPPSKKHPTKNMFVHHLYPKMGVGVSLAEYLPSAISLGNTGILNRSWSLHFGSLWFNDFEILSCRCKPMTPDTPGFRCRFELTQSTT